ncbi:MAG TPA: hypothetical protein VMC86_10985 [Gemmatimonadales bacterium]|nr:hypothetical protein [Gemmatimonadales bacterium]
MSRRIRYLLPLLLLGFTLAASACADSTGPHPGTCEYPNNNTAICN